MTENQKQFMLRAIELAENGLETDAGGPFGAVVVKNGEIIGEGWNCVTSTNDPTAHAEISAIRKACQELDSFQLEGCVLYTSCEPCPMCLGAIYWARLEKLYFGCTREDAAAVGFDDEFIYEEISRNLDQRKIDTINFMRDAALSVFGKWEKKVDKIEY